jgi:DNA-binding MarR family transcriptional regulator
MELTSGGSVCPAEAAEELGIALVRLGVVIRSLYTAHPLSRSASATLATLDRLGPRRMTALAAREGVTKPAMTKLIGRLEEAGLVRRGPDPGDGRVVQVSITDEGGALMARRRAERAQQLAALLGRLEPEHRSILAASVPAMNALADSFAEGRPPPALPLSLTQSIARFSDGGHVNEWHPSGYS